MDSEEKVLDNVSFVAKPSQTVAIIGSTGSGKSTIIKLIPRLFDVTTGKVKVGGIDVRDYDLKTLRDVVTLINSKSK